MCVWIYPRKMTIRSDTNKKKSRYPTTLKDGYLSGVLDPTVGDSERVDSPVQVECML